MNYAIACLILFAATSVLNSIYITFFHRGIAHGAITFSPWMKKFILKTGVWVTGIDPKIWSCMHRLHHAYSDTRRDPHSPTHLGVWGVMRGQFVSYQWAMMGMQGNKNEYTEIIKDLDFPISAHTLRKQWWLPHAIHAAIAVTIAIAFHGVWLGLSYWFGMMNHPIQGWFVNGFAHKYGYRNFKTSDHSTNNLAVAFLTVGEGFQNNHHAFPKSAKFSYRWFEVDPGYLVCLIAQAFGAITIEKTLIKREDDEES